MTPKIDPILITSAISPPADSFRLRLVDPVERKLQTVAACLAWAQLDSVKNIIVCDGTGAADQFRPLVPVLAEVGVELEVIGFRQSDAQVACFGKGYAEGRIIAYAIQHSELLCRSNGFFKSTGRTFVSNFTQLSADVSTKLPTFPLGVGVSRRMVMSLSQVLLGRARRRNRATWLAKWANPGVSTVFWHCPRRYFQEHLDRAYASARDREGWFVEHALLDSLLRHGVRAFSAEVAVVGESGTNDQCYPGGRLGVEARRTAARLIASWEKGETDCPGFPSDRMLRPTIG